MKKTFKMENLDCAHCAAKMETAINKLDGVESCAINFMLQKMTLETTDDDLSNVLPAVEKAIKKVDRSCKLIKPEA